LFFALVIGFFFRKRLRAWISRQTWLQNRFRRAAKFDLLQAAPR
jgi:hypothetical protein